jgi:8-oxo-dGTP diphosphatase
VLVDYLCEKTGGQLQAGDDVSAAEWVERDQLNDYEITSGTAAVIEKAFSVRQRLVLSL